MPGQSLGKILEGRFNDLESLGECPTKIGTGFEGRRRWKEGRYQRDGIDCDQEDRGVQLNLINEATNSIEHTNIEHDIAHTVQKYHLLQALHSPRPHNLTPTPN